MFRPPLWPQICPVLHELVEAEVQVPIPVGIILAQNMFPQPPPLPLQSSLKSPGWQQGPGPPCPLTPLQSLLRREPSEDVDSRRVLQARRRPNLGVRDKRK